MRECALARGKRRSEKKATSKAGARTKARIRTKHASTKKIVMLQRREAKTRRAEWMRAQQAALMGLARNEDVHGVETKMAFRAITEIAAQAMPMGRASVWLYNEDRSAIRLVDLYELKQDRHSAGTVLSARDYPAYFHALEMEERAIDAYDAHTDPRTREYSKSYLTPLGIGAMLDAPIRVIGRVVGVLCFEHLGGPRTWTPEEQSFAGSLATIMSLAMEVYERKKSDEALRAREEHLRAIIDAEPECVKLVAADGTLLEMNPSGLAMIEADNWNVVAGQSVFPLIAPEYRQSFTAMHRQVCLGEPQTLEFEIIGLKGTRRFMETHAVPLRYGPSGAVVHLAVSRDITAHKRAEEALRLAEEKYRSIFENAVEGIFQTTPDGRYLSANPALARLYGYESPQEMIEAAMDIRHQVYVEPGRRIEFRRLLEEQDAVTGFEAQVYRKDGSVIWISESARAVRDRQGTLLCYEGTVEDITERNRLEQQLLQSQKMEAIGRLAGGVAHDFNNLLTAIMGYSELLLSGVGSEEARRRNTEQIKKAAERAAALTNQLLAFSRRQVLTMKVLDLNDVVVVLEPMLRRLIGEEITLVAILDRALKHTKADMGQIEQVIMNLVVNARDAMPRGGTLTIETANVELDQAYVDRHGLVPPGAYVKLTVSDTGCGMGAETQSHIFEPFFTTKEPGRGTGLGLSTVYGVIKQSGGYIWVYSEPGQGTTFKIYLPRADEAITTIERSVMSVESPRGTETILLVEDDEAVRAVAEEALRLSGYTVLTARHSDEAFRLHGGCKGPIHLLITDVVMHGMGGCELAGRLVSARPAMKVLYMSGYTDDAVVRHGVLTEQMAFLQKPFTPDALARKVRDVLGEPLP